MKRRLLRASILLSARARQTQLVTRTPLKYPANWIGNRLEPWAAKQAFVDGVQRVNDVLMEIPRAPNWGGGGEFHLALGTYEKAEIEYLRRRLGPGARFVDVGAHVGYFSLVAAKAVGQDGAVIAFEPNAASASVLRRNAELNGFGWMEILEVAASDHDGEAELHVSPHTAMWSSLVETSFSAGGHVERVPLRSVDSVLGERGWPPIAGLKVDVEGAEAIAIRGSVQALGRNPGAFVMVEACGGDRKETSLDTIRLLDSLSFGFRRFRLGGEPSPETPSSITRALERGELFNLLVERRTAPTT